jgi:DMSO/TMAO reductase YedYZ molybdopterin-dependent catalytic subunit
MRPLPPGEPWAVGAVSTAMWGGTPLAAVLARAGIAKGASEVRFRGADRGRPASAALPTGGSIAYERSLPIAHAFAPEVLLAWERNGAPLEPQHGAPLRLIVPGWYGMASVKWLERIEVATEPFVGWFQGDRYVYRYADDEPPEPVRAMRVRALLTRPLEGAVLRRGTIVLRGWAWSGSGDVSGVEIAVDGGDRWQAARLGPRVGRWAWRGFSFRWHVDEPGRYLLRVRARDETGQVQPDWVRYNRLGYGNDAIAPVSVQVV